ncbi:hypothetical protein ACFC08_39345 [Streptomyces sp. NPDC056112]|uniref:hypothetical protein n=1 Tax=Streptomyces sp. NPDC056112 TaxID=3345715 RepID=UPI0035D6C4A6
MPSISATREPARSAMNRTTASPTTITHEGNVRQAGSQAKGESFLPTSPAGHLKGRDPSVTADKLGDAWADGATVVSLPVEMIRLPIGFYPRVRVRSDGR